jgi:predicted nucleic acid-binding protein
MIHLDTSFLIHALTRGSAQDREMRGWLAAGEALRMSSVSWAEFLCGPVDEMHVELARRIVPEISPFADAQSATAALLFNLGGRRRGSFVDCMIAAAALADGAPLATANAKDYRRFAEAGLQLAGRGAGGL